MHIHAGSGHCQVCDHGATTDDGRTGLAQRGWGGWSGRGAWQVFSGAFVLQAAGATVPQSSCYGR